MHPNNQLEKPCCVFLMLTYLLCDAPEVILIAAIRHIAHEVRLWVRSDGCPGVVSCAVIMSISTLEVIQSSAADLISGLAYGAFIAAPNFI